MPENDTHRRTHRTSEKFDLLKTKVSTTSLTKKRIKYPKHYKIPCIYLKSITNIEKLTGKKLTVSWSDFSHILFAIFTTYTIFPLMSIHIKISAFF